MKKIKLRGFIEPVSPLPLYEVGEILKLSKGLREARQTAVKHVKVGSRGDATCDGCFFQGTDCTSYVEVRCTSSERWFGSSVIFTPCLESGEPL